MVVKGSSGLMKNLSLYTKDPTPKMMVDELKGTCMKSSKQMIATIKKIIMFAAIFDGRIPVVYAFIDGNGRSVSVNGSCYLHLLQDTVWPALRSTETRNTYLWMQDIAPTHCTNDVKEFLLNKFQNQIISRGSSIIWPAHSPEFEYSRFLFLERRAKESFLSASGGHNQLDWMCQRFCSRLRPDNHQESGAERFETRKTLSQR